MATIGKENRLVVPGEKLLDFQKFMPWTYSDGGKTYSAILGIFDEKDARLVPMRGPYMPNIGDYVVGVVEEVKFAGYTVEIKSAYQGFISARDCRDQLVLGDVVLAEVKNVDEVNNVDLALYKKLSSGEILEVAAAKVPRVIGKNSSMLDLIRNATKSEIAVGKNGRIWVRGGNSSLAAAAILKIEKEAHTRGLTDRIGEFLKTG